MSCAPLPSLPHAPTPRPHTPTHTHVPCSHLLPTTTTCTPGTQQSLAPNTRPAHCCACRANCRCAQCAGGSTCTEDDTLAGIGARNEVTTGPAGPIVHIIVGGAVFNVPAASITAGFRALASLPQDEARTTYVDSIAKLMADLGAVGSLGGWVCERVGGCTYVCVCLCVCMAVSECVWLSMSACAHAGAMSQ